MYGVVPPEAVTVAAPLVPPLQETAVVAEIVDVNRSGSVMTTELVSVQLLKSIMVTT